MQRTASKLWRLTVAGLLVALLSLIFINPVYSQVDDSEQAMPTTIVVAAYEFPPFYSSRVPQHLLGLLLDTLNSKQVEYHFKIREVRPQDRYSAIMSGGCCDLMLFESMDWNWPTEVDYVWGDYLTSGSERLFALSHRIERGEVDFVVDGSRRVGGVIGYHYQFAGFETSAALLEQEYNLYGADNQRTALNMLLNERVDLAVLTDEYVRWLQLRKQPMIELVVGADAYDHSYRTRIIGKPDGSITMTDFERLMWSLYEDGTLASLFDDFGIQHDAFFGCKRGTFSC